ncbi:hypothetical protein BVX98_07010 [bacterium F11]|nr:hypothetical protein BVX98_07010 [bacterium F11]
MTKNSAISLIISLLVVFGISTINRIFRPDKWYQALSKPEWIPPSWLFGVVWPILYLFMGISLWLLWKSDHHPLKKLALSCFFLQLLFNGVWSYLFFGIHKIGFAFMDIVLLGLTILLTIFFSWPVCRMAGTFLTPYLLWISFASILNFAIWRLNK